MKKDLIILLPGPYLKRDHKRRGIDTLKIFFSVKVIDCTAWTNKKFWKIYSKNTYNSQEHIVISSKKDFLDFISQVKSPIVIDRFPISKKTNWMRKMLRKKNSLFVYTYLNLIPLPTRSTLQFFKGLLADIIKPIKFLKRVYEKLQKIKFNLMKSSSDIFVVGGLTFPSNLEKKGIINAHSFDYDVYLETKDKKKKIDKKYAVFLDEDIVDHTDHTLLNLKAPATQKEYYPTLINFLKNFELKTGLEAKIALHPKSVNKNIKNLLKDFDCSVGSTAELVMGSDLVLAHSSTSLSFAVLFKKPLVFLTTEELINSWIGTRIDNFSKVLNSQIINMNKYLNDELTVNLLKEIDKNCYKNYSDQFLKTPKSPNLPLWEIFTEHLKNNYKF